MRRPAKTCSSGRQAAEAAGAPRSAPPLSASPPGTHTHLWFVQALSPVPKAMRNWTSCGSNPNSCKAGRRQRRVAVGWCRVMPCRLARMPARCCCCYRAAHPAYLEEQQVVAVGGGAALHLVVDLLACGAAAAGVGQELERARRTAASKVHHCQQQQGRKWGVCEEGGSSGSTRHLPQPSTAGPICATLRTSIDGACGSHASHVRKRLPHLHLKPLWEAGQTPGACHACRRRAVRANGERRGAGRGGPGGCRLAEFKTSSNNHRWLGCFQPAANRLCLLTSAAQTPRRRRCRRSPATPPPMMQTRFLGGGAGCCRLEPAPMVAGCGVCWAPGAVECSRVGGRAVRQ